MKGTVGVLSFWHKFAALEQKVVVAQGSTWFERKESSHSDLRSRQNYSLVVTDFCSLPLPCEGT